MTSLSDLHASTPLHHIPAHCRRLTDDQKFDLIADAAYFLAQRRGFAAGGELSDWLEAERQIQGKFEGEYYCD